MGGVGGADFSDVPIPLPLADISSPETYSAAENILNRRHSEKNAVTRRHNRTPAHTLSVLREQNTQAHTLSDYVKHVNADPQGASVPVSGASRCFEDPWNIVEGGSHVGESELLLHVRVNIVALLTRFGSMVPLCFVRSVVRISVLVL